jgi:hypothetical protein
MEKEHTTFACPVDFINFSPIWLQVKKRKESEKDFEFGLVWKSALTT